MVRGLEKNKAGKRIGAVSMQELSDWIDHIKSRTWSHEHMFSKDKDWPSLECKYFYFDLRFSFDTRDTQVFCIQLQDNNGLVALARDAEKLDLTITELFEGMMNLRQAGNGELEQFQKDIKTATSLEISGKEGKAEAAWKVIKLFINPQL